LAAADESDLYRVLRIPKKCTLEELKAASYEGRQSRAGDLQRPGEENAVRPGNGPRE
jgi:hypothetical protein